MEKKYTKEDYEKHLAEEHRLSPISAYVKEIVYGGNDGIVTTFAVVAGFTGANAGTSTLSYSFMTVLLFGFANLFADGAAMGLGNFLSVRADQHLYKSIKAKERHEIKVDEKAERMETEFILKEQGFTPEQAKQLTDIYATNPDYWVKFMMNEEIQLPNPEKDNPLFKGIATFFSFLLFGFIPLIPYLFSQEPATAFLTACFFTLGALALIGVVRSKASNEPMLRAVAEVLAIGGTAATIAYLVGTFFQL